MKNFVVGLLIAVASLLSFDVMAGPRGGGGSGFSSRPSSGSFSRPSSSGSFSRPSSSGSSTRSSWGSRPSSGSTRPSVAPSKPSSSSSWSTRPSSGSSKTAKPATTSPSSSWSSSSTKSRSVESKVTSSTKASGTTFSSKESAVAAFKAKHATDYSAKFKSEPKVRPDYIPISTTVSGRPVTIVYNSTYGGYGYMHPSLGTWMMYDMMSDAIMMNAMMNRQGYVVGSQPAVVYNSGPTFTVLFIGLVAIVIVVGVIAANSNRRSL